MIFTDYPGHLVALILVPVSAALVFLAFRAAPLQAAQRRGYRRLLAGMHYAAVLLLLLILWNPSAWRQREVFGRNAVMAIFDTSESMSVADDGRQVRLDKALATFTERLEGQGREGPEYRIYGFDERGYHCGSPDLLRRWGAGSNLHEAFSLIADGAAREDLAGAVIFTDGRADDDDPRRYLPAGRDDLPILLVGVGSRRPRPDVAIRTISGPPTVWVDTAYNVAVTVTAANLPNVPVTLELARDDQIIETRQLGREEFDTSRTTYHEGRQAEASVELLVPAPRLGTHVLTARVHPVPGEINLANNARSTSVEVTQERSLRVLLYTQWASFDIGKIRRALAWDKRIRLDFGFDVIRDTGLAHRASRISGQATLADIQARYNEYDVIILGACEVGLDGDDMYRFVAERGGGLLLLPGKTVESLATLGNGRASATLPVLFGEDALATWAAASPERLWPPQRETITLTFEAQAARLFNQTALEDARPALSPYYQIADVKPAAMTLATVADVPIISVQRLGRGRVCLLNASKLFTLYREDREGGALTELICSLVTYLGRTPAQGAGVELFVERTAEVPRRIAFNAYVVDKAFQPVAGANVLLTAGEQVVSMEPTGRGYYRTTLDWGLAQSVVATAQAEFNGVFLGQRTIAANLPPVRDEMSCVDLDEPFLRALAERVRARYVHIDELDDKAAKLFVPKRQIGVTESVTSLWPRWPVLAVLCLLLSAGWFIRRAIGLV